MFINIPIGSNIFSSDDLLPMTECETPVEALSVIFTTEEFTEGTLNPQLDAFKTRLKFVAKKNI